MRIQVLPEGCCKSMRKYVIARQARESVSITGRTPQENKVIRNPEAKGESEGSKRPKK
jgi:hypothetical protein